VCPVDTRLFYAGARGCFLFARRCVRLNRQDSCVRVPHQKRGWPKGRQRPPRFAAALVQTLAPPPVALHTAHVINGRGGSAVGKPALGVNGVNGHNHYRHLCPVMAAAERPAPTAPTLGGPTATSPLATTATTLVVDTTGILQ